MASAQIQTYLLFEQQLRVRTLAHLESKHNITIIVVLLFCLRTMEVIDFITSRSRRAYIEELTLVLLGVKAFCG